MQFHYWHYLKKKKKALIRFQPKVENVEAKGGKEGYYPQVITETTPVC